MKKPLLLQFERGQGRGWSLVGVQVLGVLSELNECIHFPTLEAVNNCILIDLKSRALDSDSD